MKIGEGFADSNLQIRNGRADDTIECMFLLGSSNGVYAMVAPCKENTDFADVWRRRKGSFRFCIKDLGGAFAPRRF